MPIIQPIAIKACTTKKERQIRMTYRPASVSKTAKIIFPVIICIVAGLIAPVSLPLVGFLMFGNLLRECGRIRPPVRLGAERAREPRVHPSLASASP